MEIKEKIKNLINENDVCLFMKGTPEAPECGFSMAVSNILKHLNVNFRGINVLEDETLSLKTGKFVEVVKAIGETLIVKPLSVSSVMAEEE